MVKVLKRMHLDVKHGSHADMSAECTKLGGSKKNIDSRISIAIQECIACTHRGPNFTTGKVQRKESLFNKDVFIQWRRVTNHRYYTTCSPSSASTQASPRPGSSTWRTGLPQKR